ncbi:hypothetical protein [Sulfobacillus harzensis]|uniref:Uncharacterized protein n=1 Tax=Sulfobacillus harzensis TaxID=2729629 RepID=A0A7Y0Q440_9FIRM|nr:hypothetical protein [Sulfobacillus harzensis]NMP24933.1 hypothetical protein [Sulfobacillus harzensis]
MKRRIGILRFILGSVMGVLGFGLMGVSVVPVRWGSLALGVVMMGLGLLLAVGTVTARSRRQ